MEIANQHKAYPFAENLPTGLWTSPVKFRVWKGTGNDKWNVSHVERSHYGNIGAIDALKKLCGTRIGAEPSGSRTIPTDTEMPDEPPQDHDP